MLKELFLELIVKDINSEVDYYCKYFDFKIEMAFPSNENFNWVQLSNGNIKIMMQDYEETKKEIRNFPDNIFSSNIILLKYDDYNKFKNIYDLLIFDEVKMFKEIKETEYGTVEFGVYDPNGNMIIVSVEMNK